MTRVPFVPLFRCKTHGGSAPPVPDGSAGDGAVRSGHDDTEYEINLNAGHA
jgi:hypothetical protein